MRKILKKRFGIKPFTDEEIHCLKGMLFYQTTIPGCISSPLYLKYMGNYLDVREHALIEHTKQDVEQEAIKLLTKRGYKVIK